MFKKILLWFMAFTTLLMIAVFLLMRDLTKSYYFSNYSELQEEELIEKGWLPRELPNDLKDIYYQHDLDTNKLWMSAIASDNAVEKLVNIYQLKSSSKYEDKFIYPFYKFGFSPWLDFTPNNNEILSYYKSGNTYLSYNHSSKRLFLFDKAP